MKLNLVPAANGALWVRQGIRTFGRQPLAMGGLFFMFLATMTLAAVVPVLGTAIALALLPAATLGLMAATQQADRGEFPMPSALITAFRSGNARTRQMLTLGGMYAAAFLLVMGASAVMDGGVFARWYLLGGKVSAELFQDPAFQRAAWFALALYVPMSLAFWHAPALVHWHGLPAAKSLFFSFVACVRNARAYLVFGLTWVAVFFGCGLVISVVAGLMGNAQVVQVLIVPTVLLLATMFFTSFYFSFRDTFSADDADSSPEGGPPA